jgi:hypothetical protein
MIGGKCDLSWVLLSVDEVVEPPSWLKIPMDPQPFKMDVHVESAICRCTAKLASPAMFTYASSPFSLNQSLRGPNQTCKSNHALIYSPSRLPVHSQIPNIPHLSPPTLHIRLDLHIASYPSSNNPSIYVHSPIYFAPSVPPTPVRHSCHTNTTIYIMLYPPP